MRVCLQCKCIYLRPSGISFQTFFHLNPQTMVNNNNKMKWVKKPGTTDNVSVCSLHFLTVAKLDAQPIRWTVCIHTIIISGDCCVFMFTWHKILQNAYFYAVAAINARHLTLTLHLFFTRNLRINFIILMLELRLEFPRTLRHSVPPLHAFIMFSTLIFYAKNNHVRWTFACKNYVLIKCSIADSNLK